MVKTLGNPPISFLKVYIKVLRNAEEQKHTLLPTDNFVLKSSKNT